MDRVLLARRCLHSVATSIRLHDIDTSSLKTLNHQRYGILRINPPYDGNVWKIL